MLAKQDTSPGGWLSRKQLGKEPKRLALLCGSQSLHGNGVSFWIVSGQPF